MAIIKKSINNSGESVEKMESSSTVGGNVNWHSHCGRQYRDFLKKLGINPSYDPANPLWGIYPEETKFENKTKKHTHTKKHMYPMFIAALFTISRIWKQPRCPSTDELIKKPWYIYTVEYYLAIKRNAFESILMRQMKLESTISSEYHMLTHIYGI